MNIEHNGYIAEVYQDGGILRAQVTNPNGDLLLSEADTMEELTAKVQESIDNYIRYLQRKYG